MRRNLICFLVLILNCACAQPSKDRDLTLIYKNSINDYKSMVSYLEMYEKVPLLRQLNFGQGKNNNTLVSINFNPYLNLFDVNKKTSLELGQINKSVAAFIKMKSINTAAISTAHLYNDTLCLAIDNNIITYSISRLSELGQSKIRANDGLYFYKSKIYTNTANQILSIYSLDGSLIEEIDFPRETLANYLYFINDKIFSYNDYANEISFTRIDSIRDFSTEKRKFKIQDNLQLMFISDKYFICGYKNVNSKPTNSNQLVYINQNNPKETVVVNLDESIIGDKIIDTEIIKQGIDGAPEPEFRPYWRICGKGNTYYILFQASQALYLYSFELD